MTEFAIAPPATPSLPIVGSDTRFPVRRVYCIGRNYAAHAIEMGHDPERESPFFFQKNPDNLDPSGAFPYPARSADVHHEAEMLGALKSGGTEIPLDHAMDHVFGYGLALDMTRRDLQGKAKKQGRPWEIGKAFERSAPCGPVHPVDRVGHLSDGQMTLTVNGEIRQSGDLIQMIWKVPEIISYLSEYFELSAGDIILTGTPAGVGPIASGDVMNLTLAGLEPLCVTVA